MKVYVFCHLFGTHSRFLALIWHPFTFFVAYLTSIHVFCHLFGYHSRVLSLIWHPFTFFVAYLAPIHAFLALIWHPFTLFWRLFGTHSRFLVLESPEHDLQIYAEKTKNRTMISSSLLLR